jgi:hypothetical protein
VSLPMKSSQLTVYLEDTCKYCLITVVFIETTKKASKADLFKWAHQSTLFELRPGRQGLEPQTDGLPVPPKLEERRRMIPRPLVVIIRLTRGV